jgi:hypothetical protein
VSQSLLQINLKNLELQLPLFNNQALTDLESGIKKWLEKHNDKTAHYIEADVRNKYRLVWQEIIARGLYQMAEFPIFKLRFEILKKEISKASLQNLKSWFFDCIRWKRNFADTVPSIVFYEMLRKESLIHRELVRRGADKDPDFSSWKSNLQRNMSRDGRILKGRKK